MRHPYPRLDFDAIVRLLEDRFDHTFLTLADLPSPSAFKDMDRAVARIVSAIKKGEQIVLVGDYDVDGVISTTIMHRFFDAIGVALPSIIPNRFHDGYGLSPTILDRIENADVIITVDNGIAAHQAARICKSRGIDLIITDHHIVPDTPPEAYAIVDQKQAECSFPYDEVCGAQIAWYLCAGINRALGSGIDMKIYLDLVAVAVIADMMPLDGINRVMVQAGLQQFARTQWPALQIWQEDHPRSSYRAEDIAFGLAPMLNSAGRLEDASLARDFLLGKEKEETRKIYRQLKNLNDERKRLEQEVTEAAIMQADKRANVIVVSGEEWHEGVVGIAAARLVRHFRRPAIVLSRRENVCKGSGRSWRDCHLYDLLSRQREKMEKFGGHKAAIGMSIRAEELEGFIRALHADADRLCDETQNDDPDILGELPFALIDTRLLRLLEKFEPFGQGNPKPKFITYGVTLAALQRMGQEKNHLRFTFESEGVYHQGVQFKTTEDYPIGSRVDIVYTLSENHFRGETTIQLMVERVI